MAQGVVFFTSAGLFGTTFPYEVRGGRQIVAGRQAGCGLFAAPPVLLLLIVAGRQAGCLLLAALPALLLLTSTASLLLAITPFTKAYQPPSALLQYRPWYNTILWNTSGCCDMYNNQFWSMMRALFGYTGE